MHRAPMKWRGGRRDPLLPSAAFALNDGVLEKWREIGKNRAAAHADWKKRKASTQASKDLDDALAGNIPHALHAALNDYKKKIVAEKPAIATRKASEGVLDVVNPIVTSTMGGSADLTPSNNTKTKDVLDFEPQTYGGRYMRWGIREHGMCAAMNGMALHGGVIPYGGTFFVFSDYCRPSIRLAALMGIRTIFVMTHDSIGVGEDGPTHQPVEHLAALRAIPNLMVMRPADGVETAGCWQLALEHAHRPTLLAFSRQDVPTVRTTHTADNLSAKGAYELMGDANAKVTFLATGSEVGLAVQAREMLAKEGIASRIVSMPCWALFEEQSAQYRESVLGSGTVKIGIEAAVRQGWDRYIGADGGFIGMHSFGSSGPAKDVYQHFNITPEAVVEAAKKALSKL